MTLMQAQEAARQARLDCGIMTPTEAAAYIGSTEGTLRSNRCRGKGPPYQKDGGRYFYKIEDLDAYRAERAR
ncbi:helix-turn-helix domain-containing protein [Erythrobacter donghaensis]|uniref:helix-turn-helix domain-containing protein n=1 Tax=Erythrobacter donghaensis TaxID=267135 RepID=UPI000A3762D1|nr:helix-turn-helix domain-containing protein [Erythrobacter donghaensis]